MQKELLMHKFIVLFDGECLLCNDFIKFIMKQDKQKKLSFLRLQSNIAQMILREKKLPTSFFDTIYLWEDGKLYDKSSAIIRTISLLGRGWTLIRILLGIPKPIRNYVYDIISKNRNSLLKKRESCELPDPALLKRIIE